MYVPKTPWGIAILMIPLHPDDLLVIRSLPDKFQNPLMRWLQFHVRDVDDIPIKDKVTIPGNTSEKALKVLK